MSRYARKADSNQVAITAALRAAGARVAHLHTVGGGVPDLLVGYRGTNFLLELKDGALSPSRQKLTPEEEEWHASWTGRVFVVKSIEEALVAIGAVSTPPKVDRRRQGAERTSETSKRDPKKAKSITGTVITRACGNDCDDPSCRAHWRAG